MKDVRLVVTRRIAILAAFTVTALSATQIQARKAGPARATTPLYRQANAPIEKRINDLLGRMTLEEKVRQLDMCAGAQGLMDRQKPGESNHAVANAVFLPEKAETLFGYLGVGSIHDLYPTPEQANAIQKWVISHNRLGIPALFIEERLLGFDTGTVFPAPMGGSSEASLTAQVVLK